jgi:hypothetical protein
MFQTRRILTVFVRNSLKNKNGPLLQFTKIMQVSKVLAYRLNKDTGLDEYRISWKGFHAGHNSWEPFHDLLTKEVKAEALQVKQRQQQRLKQKPSEESVCKISKTR